MTEVTFGARDESLVKLGPTRKHSILDENDRIRKNSMPIVKEEEIKNFNHSVDAGI